jgi:septal ring factor EnvC (AmiA/AmiB activator)
LAAPVRSEPAELDLDLDSIGRDLERIRLEEHSLRKVMERSKSEVELLRQRIVLRGRAYYRLSRSGPAGDFFEYAVRVERLRSALLMDVSRLDRLQGEKKRADRSLAVLARRRAPLEVEARAADRARDALLEQSERERAFNLAFSSSRGSSAHTAVYSAGSDVGSLAESFAGMRGRLPFPVPGRAEVEAVRLPFAQGPGLYMKAYLGAPARSVFSGRIAYADEYPEYGKTVLIDHGDGYFTVTANLGSIEVRVGDEIPAGTRLGLTGTSGSQGRIYFEVRRSAETLNPGEWFGI